MFILDTDHVTLLERGGASALFLEMRLGQISASQLATTIVTYEEQMRGWLSFAAQSNTPQKMINAYAKLQGHIETFRDTSTLPFDAKASAQYEHLLALHLRVASMDLRIAAIVIANDATLLTRNLSDFGKIPGLRAVDWSQ